MKEILDVIIDFLPDIVRLFIAIVVAIVTKKVFPYITISKNAKMLNEAIQFAQVLVESAQRLDKSGKLAEVTKKEYVMEKLNEYIEEKGYDFSEEQLDNIRRSAVYALEQAEQIVTDAIGQIEEAAKEEPTKKQTKKSETKAE